MRSAKTADTLAWEALQERSKPIPLDPSRGHVLHMAFWRVVDGGVVVYQYQPFCTCYWSGRFPSSTERAAVAAYERHLGGREE